MLKVENVSKSFGPVKALRNATITVGTHEVVGLIGENGAGKSTLMRILSGGMRPDTGRSPSMARRSCCATRRKPIATASRWSFKNSLCSSICRSRIISICQ